MKNILFSIATSLCGRVYTSARGNQALENDDWGGNDFSTAIYFNSVSILETVRKGCGTVEKKLRALFNYQRFEGNADLQKVIDSVHSRYASRELSLDEMEWVAAAGAPHAQQDEKGSFGKRP